MELTENIRKALTSLRDAPEDKRAIGTVFNEPTGKMCACGFLAKPFGITVNWMTETDELISEIAEKVGIPTSLLDDVPVMNDSVEADKTPVYTLSQIADLLENDIKSY